MWFLETFDRLFFVPQNIEPLVIFRFAFGVVVALDFMRISIYAEHSFGERGFLPKGSVNGTKRFELFHFICDSPFLMKAYVLSIAAAGLGLAFGIMHLFCAFWVFLGFVSVHGRNPYSHHSGRKLALLWSFLLMFTTLNQYGGIWKADFLVPSRTDWALQLMRVQLCIVYFFAVLHKSQHKSWFDGSMVYKVLAGTSCRRYSVHMPSIATYRVVSSVLTWGTVGCQLVAPCLLWSPQTFLLGAAMLWSLHISLQVFLKISSFQFYLLIGPLLFLPTEYIEKIFSFSF